jgi:hypothetical protein
MHVSATGKEQFEGRCIVIHEGVAGHGAMVHIKIIATLGNQIEDLEMCRVSLVKEPVNVIGGVAVFAFEAGGSGIAHGNDTRRDICKVEIEPCQ